MHLLTGSGGSQFLSAQLVNLLLHQSSQIYSLRGQPLPLASPAHKSQLAISSPELRGGQMEVMEDLDGNSGSRLGIHKSPRRAMNLLPKLYKKFEV